MNRNLNKGIFFFIVLAYLCQCFYCCKLSAAKSDSSLYHFFSSSSVRSSRLRISNALLFNKIPSSVSIILFPLQTNRAIPNSSSNAASCLDRVGCVMCNCSAAFVKLCSFATVRKYRNILNSIPIYHFIYHKGNHSCANDPLKFLYSTIFLPSGKSPSITKL